MRKKLVVIAAIVTIWAIIISYSTAILSAASCPYGRVNCPGVCGRFTDTNNDGICDLSQTIDDKTQAPAPTSTPKPATPKPATPKPANETPATAKKPTAEPTTSTSETYETTEKKADDVSSADKQDAANDEQNNKNKEDNKESVSKTVANSKEPEETVDFKVANSVMLLSILSWSIYGLLRFIANSSAK